MTNEPDVGFHARDREVLDLLLGDHIEERVVPAVAEKDQGPKSVKGFEFVVDACLASVQEMFALRTDRIAPVCDLCAVLSHCHRQNGLRKAFPIAADASDVVAGRRQSVRIGQVDRVAQSIVLVRRERRTAAVKVPSSGAPDGY